MAAAFPEPIRLRNRTVPAAIQPMEKIVQNALSQLQFWLDFQPTQDTDLAHAETVVKGIQLTVTDARSRLDDLLARLETDSSQTAKRNFWKERSANTAEMVAARLQTWEELLQGRLNAGQAESDAIPETVDGEMDDRNTYLTSPIARPLRGLGTPAAAGRRVVQQGANSTPCGYRLSAESHPRTNQSFDPELKIAPTNQEALVGWKALSQLHGFSEQPAILPPRRTESLDHTWTRDPANASFTHDRLLGPGCQSDSNCGRRTDPGAYGSPQTGPPGIPTLRQKRPPKRSQDDPSAHEDGAHHPETAQTAAHTTQKGGTGEIPTPSVQDTQTGRPMESPRHPNGTIVEEQLQYVTNVILGQQPNHPLHQLAKKELALWRDSEEPVGDLQSIGAPLVTVSASTSTPRKAPTPREASVLLSKFPTMGRQMGMDMRYHPRLISETQTSQDFLGHPMSTGEQIGESPFQQGTPSARDCMTRQMSAKTEPHSRAEVESYPGEGTNEGRVHDTLRSEAFYTPIAGPGRSISTIRAHHHPPPRSGAFER